MFLAGCERREPVVEPGKPGPVVGPDTVPLPDPPTTTATTTAPAADPPRSWQPPDDPGTTRFLGLVAEKPASWIEHPPRGPMRLANITVPGRAGSEAAHIVVFYFGADQGGTIDANIDRWQTQFQPDENNDLVEPVIERFEVNTMPVTLVELAGSWRKMGATWYTADQLFLMAIVETPRGKLFIRFAGQAATVEANRADFVKMLESLEDRD